MHDTHAGPHALPRARRLMSVGAALALAVVALLAGCGAASQASPMTVYERAVPPTTTLPRDRSVATPSTTADSAASAAPDTTSTTPPTTPPTTVAPPPAAAPPSTTAPRPSRSNTSKASAGGSSWACRIDENVPAQRDLRYSAFAGNLGAAGLPRASVERIANQLPLIDANMWAYCGAERATGVPALVLAAIHYREANNDPHRSIMSGEQLGSVNPDTHQVEPGDLGANAIRAAQHLRDMARSVYGITVRTSMSPAELAYAALAYNRGSMYCRGAQNGVGQMHPMMSPYVSSGLFEDWVGMAWPDVGGSSVGSPEAWGEPASVRGRPDLRPGVYVVLRGLGSEIGIQQYAWNTSEVQIPCR